MDTLFDRCARKTICSKLTTNAASNRNNIESAAHRTLLVIICIILLMEVPLSSRKHPAFVADRYNKKYYPAPKKRLTAQEHLWKKWVLYLVSSVVFSQS